MNSFASLDLIEPLQRALADEGYSTPTPIQAQAIPPLLEGDDVLGCAQTGTGKTAAFLLPMIQSLANDPWPGKRTIRALVLTPTRELAAQIGENFEAYSRYIDLKHLVIFGGVNQNPQVQALRKGIDVLVATPGRLLDLHGQGYLNFEDVEFFVLDEADRMLDMGFIHDMRRVMKLLPDDRQNLLFSATMPDQIVKLARGFMHDPVKVEVDPQSTTVERITQKVMFVTRADKKRLLAHLLKDPSIWSAIVFTRTKHGANRVVKDLTKVGVGAAAIHGNKSQNARLRALAGFKSGEIRVLVATDIAARGIDVDDVSHVFNYDLPNISESYVHRIGRTGRAGREGIAIAFCDETETDFLKDIEKLTGVEIERVVDHDWHLPEAMPKVEAARPGQGRNRRRGGQGSGQHREGQQRGGQRGDGQRREGQRRDGQRRDGQGRSRGTSSGNTRNGQRRSDQATREAPRDEQRASTSGQSASDQGATGEGQRRRRRRRPSGGGAAKAPREQATSQPNRNAGGGQSAQGQAPSGDRPRRRRRRRRGGGGGQGPRPTETPST
ncbi:MAG: DEAD/DEAH box helicase [Bradymonadia bacterium]